MSKHPRGLYPLFFTEMWERFSFYLMLGLLYQYLVDPQSGMGWTPREAASVYGSYIALVYFTPFLGGITADRLLGCRKTIIIGGVFMMIGHIVLALPGTTALYTALLCLIIGNGFFKPNISTLVGNLYPPGSPLKDAGFNIFYMGINIGAFVCNFVAALVRNAYGWHAAFATAGVGMFIGLVIFIAYQKMYADVDPDPRDRAEPAESLQPLFVRCLAPAAVMAALGFSLVQLLGTANANGTKLLLHFNGPTFAFLFACVPVVLFYVTLWRGIKDRVERGRVGALLTIFGVVVIFWAIFHQNGTALTDWAVENTDRRATGAIRAVTDRFPAFDEDAPLGYYDNAGPDTPRPSREQLRVVSDEEYAQLRKDKQLGPGPDGRVPVTQATFDDIYQHASAQTPVLTQGEPLQLVNAELFLSVNAGLVVLFTPILVAFWRGLNRRGMEPSTPAKIGLGLLLTAGGPAVMLFASIATHDGTPMEMKASPWWLVGAYVMLTLGELCLSPMGLSLVSKMAPARMRSLLMGGWFLSTAVGNKLSGIFGELYTEWDHRAFYLLLIACVVVAAAAIFAMLPWLKSEMPREGVPAPALDPDPERVPAGV